MFRICAETDEPDASVGAARCPYGSPHWSSTVRVSWPAVGRGRMERPVAACCYREERSQQHRPCRCTGVYSRHGSSRHSGRSCRCTRMCVPLILLERHILLSWNKTFNDSRIKCSEMYCRLAIYTNWLLLCINQRATGVIPAPPMGAVSQRCISQFLQDVL